MKLDRRLQAVADFVQAGSRAADIGTDHAYLAMQLMAERGAAAVIASDKTSGPCQAARRTLREAGLAEQVAVRQGDGLTVLEPGEADTICIAGMGGELITLLLAAAPLVLAQVKRLVLQPMNDVPLVRQWLYARGWHLAAERLAEADGRLYVVLLAEPGEAVMPEPVLLAMGPWLWAEKPPLFPRYVRELYERDRQAAAGMEKSERMRQEPRYLALVQEIHDLEAKLGW